MGNFDYYSGDANGDGWYTTGSGFFVGKPGENPSYFITNDHVIEDFLARLTITLVAAQIPMSSPQ